MTDRNHPIQGDLNKGYASGKTPPQRLASPHDAGPAGGSQESPPTTSKDKG
jgi:hypothetical protein